MPNSRRAVDLLRDVEPRQRLAQQLEVLRILQRDVLRHRQRRGLVHERAVLQAAAAGLVDDLALLGRAACSRATPQVCAAAVTSIARAVAPASRRIFHMPRTLLLPAVSCWPPKFGLPYFASAGAHSVLIFAPVDVELFGHEHRHRGHHALAHFELRQHDA